MYRQIWTSLGIIRPAQAVNAALWGLSALSLARNSTHGIVEVEGLLSVSTFIVLVL